MRLHFTKCHGSGNDFPLIDARAIDLDDAAWAAIARILADRNGPVGGDGLLLLTVGKVGNFGMRMFNSDGSEAETCLNGLRCVARAGFEALGIEAATVSLKASTAEVDRAADVAPGVYSVRTRAQATQGIAATGPLSGLPSDRSFTAVSMPNPHLITFVDGAVDEKELVALGSWCETAPPLLPERANVSFVEMRGEDIYVRTFERGVGLTNACGSAMAASVYAACLTGRVAWDREIIVFNKGGLVRGAASEAAQVTITGNATFEWDGAINADGSGLEVLRRRSEEVAAWDGVIAGLAG